MTDVVRVACRDRWAYVPVGTDEHAILVRLAQKQLADNTAVEVRLRSDAGPIIWEALAGAAKRSANPPPTALASLSENSIELAPDEALFLGKEPGSISYNQFADLSLMQARPQGRGLPLSSRGISDGDIVMTAWPKARRLIPGRVGIEGRRREVELAEPPPRGQRCFVLDEDGRAFLTVGMPSDVADRVRFLPPSAVDTWLFSAGSRAAKSGSERYRIQDVSGARFVIMDRKTGKKYAGKFMSEGERLELEKDRLEWLLANRGLGGVLPIYELEKP